MNITITNGTLTAEINPKGAELVSLKDSKREYIWEGDHKYWGKHSPVLFPIVGTLKNNTYLYQGKIHALTRHGFARDNEFTVKEQHDNLAVFALAANTESKRVYPFSFELEIHYSINEKSLEIEYKVNNKGEVPMLFSIGAHPAFALPGKFSNYSLKFEREEKLISAQLENDLLSGKSVTLPAENGLLPLDYKLFKDDALVFTQLQSKEVIVVEDKKDLLKVAFSRFPHLGIWTKENAPFICIEPWQGYADAHDATGNLIEKPGIINLDPNKSYSTGFTIEILK